MDLRSNRVENGNWLVLVPLTSWRTNRNIFSVKQACLMCPKSQGAPVSPMLYFEIIPFIHIYTSAPVQSQFMPSVAQRVAQITWQSEDDIYRGLQ